MVPDKEDERSVGNEGSERCPENELWFVCLQRRCNPEGSDGCNAGRTGSAKRRKPVMEVMIRSPQGVWNEKVKALAWLRGCYRMLRNTRGDLLLPVTVNTQAKSDWLPVSLFCSADCV
ncbi:hypothetical protein XENOCAPTIV_025346 [Xenoophorus captivus]|uniref:Uncharacterized protein n=1 Tax=Xenoophorus captivus TaxID=1517983 RepID=A0ABV0QV94_9TELE